MGADRILEREGRTSAAGFFETLKASLISAQGKA
jgi:hypothetical protein